MEENNNEDSSKDPPRYEDLVRSEHPQKTSNKKPVSIYFIFSMLLLIIPMSIMVLGYVLHNLSIEMAREDSTETYLEAYDNLPELMNEFTRSEILSTFENIIKRREIEYNSTSEKDLYKELKKVYRGHKTRYFRYFHGFQTSLKFFFLAIGDEIKYEEIVTPNFRKFKLNSENIEKLIEASKLHILQFMDKTHFDILMIGNFIKNNKNGSALTDEEISRIKSASVSASKKGRRSYTFESFSYPDSPGRDLVFKFLEWEDKYTQFCGKNYVRPNPPLFFWDIVCASEYLRSKNFFEIGSRDFTFSFRTPYKSRKSHKPHRRMVGP